MQTSTKLSAIAAMAVLGTTGCAVMHHKEAGGQYVDDSTISARAKAALIRDNEVRATDFSISVYQGNVTLTGVAANAEQSKRAEQDIRAVDGVKSVENDVRIASTERPPTR